MAVKERKRMRELGCPCYPLCCGVYKGLCNISLAGPWHNWRHGQQRQVTSRKRVWYLLIWCYIWLFITQTPPPPLPVSIFVSIPLPQRLHSFACLASSVFFLWENWNHRWWGVRGEMLEKYVLELVAFDPGWPCSVVWPAGSLFRLLLPVPWLTLKSLQPAVSSCWKSECRQS